MNNSDRGLLYGILVALLFGFLAIGLKIGLQWVDPMTVSWFRFLVSAIVTAGYMAIFNPVGFRIFLRPPWELVVSALGLSINYYGFIVGVDYTTPSIAQVFIQLGPIGLALSGIFIFREEIKRRQVAGLMLVLGGLSLFFLNHIVALNATNPLVWKGVKWVVVAAVTWAVYAIMQKKLILRYQASEINLFIYTVSTLFFTPFIHPQALQPLSFGQWLLLVYLGLTTVVSYGLLTLALKWTEAHKISVIIIFNPIITFATVMLAGYIGLPYIHAESFSAQALGGALLVLAGGAMAVYNRRHRKN